VQAVDHQDGRDAGALQAKAGTADPIDATVVLLAQAGDRILTSDPHDISRLAAAAANGKHHRRLPTIAYPAREWPG
jgi:hypothetical protein